MAKPSIEEIKKNIQDNDIDVWHHSVRRPDALEIFEADLSRAIALTWSDIEDAFVINPVPVNGGTSTSGGPLQDGVAELSEGMLTNDLSFKAIKDIFSTSFNSKITEGLLALVEAISLGIGQNFSKWMDGYSITLVASGGKCEWTPWSSGKWTGGTVEASSLSNGSSSGDEAMTAIALLKTIDNKANPSMLKQNQNQLQPALRFLIDAIAKGFEATWLIWKSQTNISDGVGSGTATPPNGAIKDGTVTNLKVE